MKNIALAILLFTGVAYAAATRTIDADTIKSSDHTKTWTMPGTTGTVARDEDLQAHISDTTDAHAGSAITNTPSGNLAASTVQGALNELQTDVDTRLVKASNLSDLTNAGTARTNLGLGTMATQNANAVAITAGTLSGDFQGGTASDTSRITLPKAASATLSALTRKQGTIVFDTDVNKPYFDNGSTLLAIGTGSGSGDVNHITYGDAEIGTNGWVAGEDSYKFKPSGLTVVAANDTISYLSTYPINTPVEYFLVSGASGISGLTTSTVYYVISSNKLSATLGGSAVDITAIATGDTVLITPLKPITGASGGTGGGAADSDTFARTNTAGEILRDDDKDGSGYSYRITHAAENNYGATKYYDFTVEKADYDPPKMQTIEFYYKAISGTFQYGNNTSIFNPADITVWIYGKDSGTLIQPTVYTLDGSGKYVGQFQPLTTDNDYRLILFSNSTNNAAFVWVYDSVKVGPKNIARGPPMSDWAAYTPTTNGLGTPTSISFFWRRVGSDVEIQGRLVTGTATASEARIGLPSGTIDSTAVPSIRIAGRFARDTASATTVKEGIALATGGNSYLQFSRDDYTDTKAPLTAQNGSAIFGNSETVSVTAVVTVSGWSSNTQGVIDEGRTVAVEYSGNAGTALTGGTTNIDYATKVRDTHSAWSGTVFTAPLAGDYQISATMLTTASTTGRLDLYKNAAQVSYCSQAPATDTLKTCSQQIYLVAGDTLSLRSSANGTLSNTALHRIAIHRIAGPSLPQPTETVAAKYRTTAGQTCTTGSTCLIDFGTIDYDTHGAVTTGASWKFTAPIAGKYSVQTNMIWNAPTASSAGKTMLYKNGSFDTAIGYQMGVAGAGRMSGVGAGTITLVQGDYIDVRWNNGDSNTRTMDNTVGNNFISITKVGN